MCENDPWGATTSPSIPYAPSERGIRSDMLFRAMDVLRLYSLPMADCDHTPDWMANRVIAVAAILKNYIEEGK